MMIVGVGVCDTPVRGDDRSWMFVRYQCSNKIPISASLHLLVSLSGQVACDQLPIGNWPWQRRLDHAALDGQRAARVEAAASRQRRKLRRRAGNTRQLGLRIIEIWK